MSGVHRLSDMPLQTYSLDSINEFLQMETATRARPPSETAQSQKQEESEDERLAPMQSAYSFAKKDNRADAPVREAQVSRETKNIADPTRSLVSAREEKKAISEVNTTARVIEISQTFQSASAKDQNLAKIVDREQAGVDKASSLVGGITLSGTHGQSSVFSHGDKKHSEPRRNHHPQILDEDTERFKLRLEELVSKFKLETLTEFMSAKKHLLDEQASVIGQEKMYSDTRYQSKCFEVSVC